MNKWRLIDYFDIWGNENDGYEVNNLCVVFDDLFISDGITNGELIDYLKKINFFSEDATENTITVNDMGDMIEFETSDNGYPLCRLERVFL